VIRHFWWRGIGRLARKSALRLSAHGFGDADPVASNDTAKGRAQN
jgi:flagellar motor protein MotB